MTGYKPFQKYKVNQGEAFPFENRQVSVPQPNSDGCSGASGVQYDWRMSLGCHHLVGAQQISLQRCIFFRIVITDPCVK